MKFLPLLLTAALLSITSGAQKLIKPEEIKEHIGDSVKVGGKISGVQSSSNSKKPTFIYIGANCPNQLLTLVVYKSYKTANTEMPTENYMGNIAIATGKVEMYKGRPQIIIRSPNQLYIVAAGAAAPTKK